MDGWMDGWMERWRDGGIDGWMDGRTDGGREGESERDKAQGATGAPPKPQVEVPDRINSDPYEQRAWLLIGMENTADKKEDYKTFYMKSKYRQDTYQASRSNRNLPAACVHSLFTDGVDIEMPRHRDATLRVMKHMKISASLDKGTPNMEKWNTRVKKEMNDWLALYRRQQSYYSLYSAINTLARGPGKLKRGA
ncbi:hypothetical protein AK812_SmicGene29980 [Symbiodinium microadriaticum]|uniref:Uncharacterized protein n=1 Tax=Symbiodinium microadriaticum TaxID=2951 RepID=A0A1Q9D0F5_SYMMI|nr:hypothetical protein AK812_SmicGene29980 [Symbiodinium microadriaticum]